LKITWNPTINKLCGKTQAVTPDKITRRDVVSEIVIKVKIFMQGLTKEKFKYNEELPTQSYNKKNVK